MLLCSFCVWSTRELLLSTLGRASVAVQCVVEPIAGHTMAVSPEPTVHCMPTMPLAFANNLILLCWRLSRGSTGCGRKTGGHTSWWSVWVTKPTNGRHEMLCVWASIVISLSLPCFNSNSSAPASLLMISFKHLHCYGYTVHLSRCLLELEPN